MALTLAEVEAADADTEINLNVVTDPRDSPAKWHSIRPWHPRLALSVTEITSVSATFVVSSLSSNILRHHDNLDIDDDDTPIPDTDTLSKGISVNVNGTPWRKCLARLADDADEATIIIHGLLPGLHYDIELGIIPGDEKLKGQIVTESETVNHAISDSESSSGIPQVGAFPSTSSSPPAIDRSPSPPSTSPPPTPNGAQSYSSQTFEDYLGTLQLSLSHLQAEHESLSSTLRSARRDSQKAQAAQRAEISSLKRAAQKHSSGDTRMKQKSRALEEAVKQAIKCREDVEAEYAVLEAAGAEQETELADALRRYEEARARAEDWRSRREKAEEEANSKLRGARAELAAVEARLEKLRAKREKLDGRTGAEEDEGAEGDEESGEGPSRRADDEDGLDVPGGLVGELEAKLREMLLERERIEADPYGQFALSQHTDEAAVAVGLGDKVAPAAEASPPGHHAPHHGRNASSHTHAHPPPASRNKQRPGPLFSPHHHHSQSHSHPHSHPPHSHSHSHSHSARPSAATMAASTSFSSGPASAPPVARAVAAAPTLLTRNPHGPRGSGGGTGAGPGKGSVARRKSSPPPHSHMQTEKSSLSLNAPPFEPASIKGRNNARAVG